MKGGVPLAVCDVAIIGGGTSGAYFAREMARRGYAVTVIDALPRDKIGTKYDIFHIAERDFARFEIPRPVEGDPAWAFEFAKNRNADPENRSPVTAMNPTVGLHLREYTLLLVEAAEKAGAKFVFDASFDSFLFEDGKISGLRYKRRGRRTSLNARCVVDCSGIPAVGRTQLPPTYGMETFPLGGDDMFYVTLRYVKLLDEKDYLDGSTFWAYYKSWIAPCADPKGAIIGVGAVTSFEHCDKIYEDMCRHIDLPTHTVERVERGATPYRRPPYTLVADRFIACGDAACLTKSESGEGVTSAMTQIRIAADALDRALTLGDASKELLWNVNKRYNDAQGADFAFLRALLTGVINAATFDEFKYVFASGAITDGLMDAVSAGAEPKLTPAMVMPVLTAFLKGIATGRLSRDTLKAAARALKNALEIKAHYLDFPPTTAGYYAWVLKADVLWHRVGKMR